jgi:hypothetical protein
MRDLEPLRDIGIVCVIIVLLQCAVLALVFSISDNRPVYAHPRCVPDTEEQDYEIPKRI